MQPNSLSHTSSHGDINLNIAVRKNYSRFQIKAFKLGFAISVGTANILIPGFANQAFGVDVDSVENRTSEESSSRKGERITKAILRGKVNNSSPNRRPAPSLLENSEKSQAIAPIPVGQYPRGTRVSPNLPPLAAVERYLPKPIDRNTAPPIVPGGVNLTYIWPAKGVLTSGYGMRWGRMHRGIDIANKIGTPILAAASGVVEFEGRQRGYGNIVDIRHIDGSLTRYAHNHRHFVKVGQRVQQGQMIAHMGNTGFSTGPHLHFEIHPSGKGAVNPISFLPPQL